MKKHSIILLLTLLLPLSIQALNVADLDVDVRVKQQILDSFTLRQSIDQFVTDNSNIPVVTVGGDNACDYRIGSTKIQDAINEHTTVEIRIAYNEIYNENLVINDNSVILRGGYSNCTDAANGTPQYSRTTINSVLGVEEPVLKILGDSQRNTIILDSLVLANGRGATDEFPGGGISTYQANVQIGLYNFMSNNNHSVRGGGIAIVEGNTDIAIIDSKLFANTARVYGGGLYCNSIEASVTMYGLSGITSNKATGPIVGTGGGVALINSCSFLSYSGSKDVSNNLLSLGIDRNIANYGGGGIYAWDSLVTLFGHKVCISSSICFGNNTEPVNLTNNQAGIGITPWWAGGGSGGTQIGGLEGSMFIYAGKFTGNKTKRGWGGAIGMSGNANLNIDRLSTACWSQQNCNYFANNSATANNSASGNVNFGGAIGCTGATMSITNAVFAYNRADRGTAMYLDNCTTNIQGSLMYQNGNHGNGGEYQDQYVIYNEDGVMEIYHSTIADNKSIDTVIKSISDFDSAGSKIVASIIHDASTGPVLSGDSEEIDVECSILHEDESVTLKAFTIVDDPEFIDRANYNYHINAQTSPAVDYCYTNTGNYRDMDFEERGWDDTSVTDLHGPYDIGADETYGNDIIFTNGFN